MGNPEISLVTAPIRTLVERITSDESYFTMVDDVTTACRALQCQSTYYPMERNRWELRCGGILINWDYERREIEIKTDGQRWVHNYKKISITNDGKHGIVDFRGKKTLRLYRNRDQTEVVLCKEGQPPKLLTTSGTRD